MRCLEEALAVGGGCKFREKFFQNIPLLIFHDSYTIMLDMAQSNYVHQSVPDQIWPNLLYLYHRNKERGPLHMVQGEFY